MGEDETRAEIRYFVGNRDEYYLRQWGGLLETGRGWAGFNWAAFLFSLLWVSYRKMYGVAAIIAGAIIIESVMEYFYFVDHLGRAEVPGFLDPLVGVGVGVVCGFFGNQWYFRHATKRILNVRSQEPDVQVRSEKLIKRGGTSWLGMIIFIFACFVANVLVLGIASLALNMA